MGLKDKVIIVTGAGTGIGKACTMEAARRGAKVAVVDMNPGSTEQSAEDIKAIGAECIPVVADISLEQDTARMAKAVRDHFKRIDILVNNAGLWGVLSRKPIDQMPVEEWDRVMAVNLRGTFLAIKAVYPIMREQKYGKIINIASTTAFFGSPFLLHYVTSKAGIIGLTRSVAREVGEYGICVNAVAPGFTLTDGSLSNTGQERANQLATQTILKRVALPQDIVGTILFLAGPESDFMTGQTLVVDGGMVLH
ncbi:MAG TPA: 3-oxoacyl-ACP reductase family protein [Syntrophorhabdaceae bacterium]|nr:3-oxoacyl-ACP reductase family protein [Syntrophorhabdaceae bacterium]